MGVDLREGHHDHRGEDRQRERSDRQCAPARTPAPPGRLAAAAALVGCHER